MCKSRKTGLGKIVLNRSNKAKVEALSELLGIARRDLVNSLLMGSTNLMGAGMRGMNLEARATASMPISEIFHAIGSTNP